MACLNVVSLPKHIDEVRLILAKTDFDILALNETRLDSSISNGLIGVAGYDIIRCDRNRSDGGVCIYIRKSITYSERPDLVADNLEAVCLEVAKPNSRPFIVSSIYRPPSAPVELFNNIEHMIGQIDNDDKEVYILGDLNCNLLDPTNQNAQHLCQIMELYQLTQLIKNPTRITDLTSSLLDVCITSCPEKILHSDIIHVGFSDHSLIYIVRKINNPFKHKRKKEVEIRNFKNFNSEHFLEDLRKKPWGKVEYETDVNAMWTRWKTLFLEVLDRHAPIRLRRVRNKI